MFKKAFKALLYFVGLNGSQALSDSIKSVEDNLKQNVTLYCPDFIACPITSNCNRDCKPNFMPTGVSQAGISVSIPCESSTYHFVKASDWHDRDEGNICYYESKKSPTETRYASIRKNLGASFFADTSQQNSWVKADANLNICTDNNPKICPFY